MSKQGILVVSFGTTHEDTREITIDRIINKIKEAYPEHRIFEAYTSNIVRTVLRERYQISMDSVEEALEKMAAENITEVIVQPTHILNGFEYEKMVKQVEKKKACFETVEIGSPLLTSTGDYLYFIEKLLKEMPTVTKEEAILFMGHGSDHFSNVTYSALNHMFLLRGYENVYIATVEAYPFIEDIIMFIRDKGYQKIYLAPFMIVAGEHAKNDMIGDEEDSWKSILEAEGYQVEPIMKGLGEYSFTSEIFIQHITEAMKRLSK